MVGVAYARRLIPPLIWGLGIACNSNPSAVGESAGAKASSQTPAPRGSLKPGDQVPNLKGLSHIGYAVSLEDFRGEGLTALYYCAALDTACEQLATGVRDAWLVLRPKLAMALFFTPLGLHENRAFATNLELPQLLVSDRGGAVLAQIGFQSQGVPSPRAYLVDSLGKVVQVFETPFAPNHLRELEAALAKSSGGPPAPQPAQSESAPAQSAGPNPYQ